MRFTTTIIITLFAFANFAFASGIERSGQPSALDVLADLDSAVAAINSELFPSKGPATITVEEAIQLTTSAITNATDTLTFAFFDPSFWPLFGGNLWRFFWHNLWSSIWSVQGSGGNGTGPNTTGVDYAASQLLIQSEKIASGSISFVGQAFGFAQTMKVLLPEVK